MSELWIVSRYSIKQQSRRERLPTDTSDTVSLELGAIRETVETAA
jgi:hypothetical protein